MPRLLKVYLVLLPLLFALDFIWIGTLSGGIYNRELHSFLRISGDSLQPIVWAGVLVYAAMAAGLVLFVLPRVEPSKWIRSSIGWGALFGAIVYAIYDLTNYSLFSGWPLHVTCVDIAWGGVINALGALGATALERRLR
jgi:uncharacterized membrane protein